MDGFDQVVLSFLNRMAQRSWTFDSLVVFFANFHLLKGILAVCFIWWAWFHPGKAREQIRQVALLTLCAACAAVVAGQILQRVLPPRLRPLYTPDLGLTIPHSVNPDILSGLSSFPSDHAVLFFALAVGLGRISRRAGILLLFHAAIVVALPRVYLTYHYPTDILAGAIIGGSIAYGLTGSHLAQQTVQRFVLRWADARPWFFYPMLFLLTYQLGTLFEDLRSLGDLGHHLIRAFSRS